MATREETRLANVQLATEVRSRRSALKRQLTNGEIHLDELLANPPDWAERMRLVHVLKALPRISRKTAERALAAAQASEFTTLDGLSDRQRLQLFEHFKSRMPAVWDLWNVMATPGNHEYPREGHRPTTEPREERSRSSAATDIAAGQPVAPRPGEDGTP